MMVDLILVATGVLIGLAGFCVGAWAALGFVLWCDDRMARAERDAAAARMRARYRQAADQMERDR